MNLEDRFSVFRATGEELQTIWPICTELSRKMSYPSFFCTGDWLKAAAAHVHPEESLLLVLVKESGKPKAVLPLVSKRNLLGGNDLYFLGVDYFPDPLGLICAPGDRAESANAIKDFLLKMSGWDRLVLDWILEDEVRDWKIPGVQVSVEPFKILPNSFDEVLGEFKQKKRYNLRAMVRRFFDAGGEVVMPHDKSSRGYFLDSLFGLHQKRAAEKSIRSNFEGHAVMEFHRRLMEVSPNGRLYGLSLNRQLVSVLYGFDFCNKFFYYQVAHDPNHGDLSPGAVLLFLVIEDCCKRGLKEFNFLQGNENYKAIWSKEARVLYQCVLKRGTLRSRVFDVLNVGKDNLKMMMTGIRRGA